jgi:Zn-dependent protease with chaperone function
MFKLRSLSVVAFACLILTQAAQPGRSDELANHKQLAESVMERLLAVVELPESYDAAPVLRIVEDETVNAYATLDQQALEQEGKVIPVVMVTTGLIERMARFEADSLAFIVAHELGHHVLGHVLASGEVSVEEFEELHRQQEIAADEFALELILKAGFQYHGDPRSLLFG